jgi:UDP-N-acetylglucosamine:LPS N-acetylglucosamine transferase
MTTMTSRIALVYFDAGGGHRSAATALQQVIRQNGSAWQPDLVNLQEILDPLDVVRRLTGIRVQDVYNRMLRSGWTLGSAQLMRALQLIIRAYHVPSVRLLESYWRNFQPDLVVSLVPHFNRALCQSLAAACPGKPFVTVLTDFADYPPHFWIERQEQFLICGSERAVEQARRLGHAPEKIFETSGMILNPRFYDYPSVDRARERERLGLDPSLATGLVLFGGQGSQVMLEIDRRLGRSSLPLQLIFICGKNESLGKTLRAQPSQRPRFVEGFTAEIPYYMQLADFLIGKPGPGSIAEAMVMDLPVIVERNAWTLPQERYNTEWVREKQVGLVVPNFRRIDQTVAALLDPATFFTFQSNIRHMHNRALFEIPVLLSQILAGSTTAPAPANLTLPANSLH